MMIYELRIYHMHPGRMEAICNRFRDHTLPLFPKHGIKVVDFWLDASGDERLYYVCEFDSREAMDAAWLAFRADPIWLSAKEKSEQSGLIVEHADSYVMENAPFFSKN